MIQILDTTLREGEQTPGVYFDSHIKLAIADLLDEIGIDIIEAGRPLVSQDIHDAVKQIAYRNLNALVGAHARSLEKDIDLALECGVGFLGIFYCVSDARLNPELVGKRMDISLDHMSGISSVKWALEKNEIDAPDDLVYKVLDKVKSVGQRGRTVGFKELPYIVEWCKENDRQVKRDKEN